MSSPGSTATSPPDARSRLFASMHADRVLGHEWVFEHRHKAPAPAYQPDLIEDFHSREKHFVDMVFRGGSKSTIAEEAIILQAGFQEFRYCLVVGNTIDRACQRLHAIRREFETNERLEGLFGDLRGAVWSVDQLELRTGVMIQALGRGQSLRGAKHLDQRPDFLFGDDLEEWGDVNSEKARGETWRWFQSDLIPALDPSYRAHVAGTPLHPDCLLIRLERDGWSTRRIPVVRPHPTEAGVRVSSWPERFPLTREDARQLRRENPDQATPLSIEEMEYSHQRNGTMARFNAEMLCDAAAPEDQVFTPAMFRGVVHPQAPSWQAVYAMFDPARTVKETSAFTGWAVWSWVGPKLIVWDGRQEALMPDAITNMIFAVNDTYRPVEIGVEEDGLNEFLLQPLRMEQVRRGVMLPLRPMRAPKGKYDFIRGLQIWFNAREVEFAQALPDLEDAFLAFPRGKIDAANALAYAPLMRGGAPIYGDFNGRHVAGELVPSRQAQCYLALNATRTLVSGALVQLIDGALRVYADWIAEGEPADVLGGMVAAATLAAGGPVQLVAPPPHFDAWSNVGLRQAAGRIPRNLSRGAPADAGRVDLRNLLQREVRGMPAAMIAEQARWTLNGFAGGYHHALLKQAMLAPYAEEGLYKVLMEGIESFVGAAFVRSTAETDVGRNFAVAPDGRRYESAMPQRR